eukprot:433987-Prorocentrum_minimum.AAC.1
MAHVATCGKEHPLVAAHAVVQHPRVVWRGEVLFVQQVFILLHRLVRCDPRPRQISADCGMMPVM